MLYFLYDSSVVGKGVDLPYQRQKNTRKRALEPKNANYIKHRNLLLTIVRRQNVSRVDGIRDGKKTCIWRKQFSYSPLESEFFVSAHLSVA